MLGSSLFKSLRKKLMKGFAIYLGSTIINKSIPFLLLPILTDYLSTEEYGALAIFQVIVTFGDTVIGLRMKSNINRNFFSKEKDVVAQIVYNMLLLLTASASVFLLLITAYIGLGGPLFSIPQRWFYVLPFLAFMNMVNTYNLAILRNRKRALEYGALEIGKTILNLSVSLLLIIAYGYGWEGRAYGIVSASFALCVLSLIRLGRSGYIKAKIDVKKMKEIMIISLPLIFHGLGTTVISLSDRIFIDQMIDTSAVGIYTVGYQFGMIMFLVVTAFNLTWTPWMYQLLSKELEKNKRKIVKATYLMGLVYIGLALGITLVSYFLLPVMTPEEYHSAFTYVIWIALGFAFNGMYSLVQPYGVHVGKTGYVGITTMIAAIINLVLNYYLIGKNGPVGAAQATLISYVLMFLTVWWYSNRLYPMPWFRLLRTTK